jgi:hypothetical protein
MSTPSVSGSLLGNWVAHFRMYHALDRFGLSAAWTDTTLPHVADAISKMAVLEEQEEGDEGTTCTSAASSATTAASSSGSSSNTGNDAPRRSSRNSLVV